MTDDPELDRVRMVLDFTPAEVYDEFPEQERKLLESLDRRLDRTVAVKKRDRVRVVVERPGTDRERVREYHPPTIGPASSEPDEAAEPEGTVQHEVFVKEVGEEEPDEAAEPGEAEEPAEPEEPDVRQEVVLEEVEVTDTAEPRSMELDLDEPPEPYAPAEPSEVHRESETEWPDPDERYEELHGQDLEDEDEEPVGPAWPDAPEEEPEIWPEEPVEEPSDEEVGSFEEVSVSPSEPAEPGGPAEESELGWPGVDDEPDEPAADEPSGFEDVGTSEPFEPETTGEEPSDEREEWIVDSFAGEETEAADVSATDDSTADDDVIQKSFPPGTTREEIEEWAREHGYRIRNIERDDED